MRYLVAIAVILSLFTITGCKPSDKAFCDKMRDLYGDRMDDCEEDALPEIRGKCKDPDAVIECMMDADDKKAADQCFEDKCERK